MCAFVSLYKVHSWSGKWAGIIVKVFNQSLKCFLPMATANKCICNASLKSKRNLEAPEALLAG
ncbi:hypothetical protein BDV27DRAFT_124439 [Aspergillus caelatus]|uniref:Uncharacterized protein n=1 Tax=Aspergillus caelatus TaxID=61420 RepID=A0A5N7AB03_9EURO|nr:uncharacterized protein BDV27DRAFT_124439 [Aspergillus caelatus]KAE8367077.1 hypothetical protein BDV27DRAFT_124439 [Aspergillus caelatus]